MVFDSANNHNTPIVVPLRHGAPEQLISQPTTLPTEDDTDVGGSTTSNPSPSHSPERDWPEPIDTWLTEDNSATASPSSSPPATPTPPKTTTSNHSLNAPLAPADLVLSLARSITAPALKSSPDSFVKFLFPCLRSGDDEDDNTTSEPPADKWTPDQEREVTAWCARGLELMLEGGLTRMHFHYDAGSETSTCNDDDQFDGAGSSRVLGYSALCWEYGSEAELASRAACEALEMYEDGVLGREDVEGLPGVMDLGRWLVLGREMNRMREGVWKGVGDVFVGSECPFFVLSAVVVVVSG